MQASFWQKLNPWHPKQFVQRLDIDNCTDEPTLYAFSRQSKPSGSVGKVKEIQKEALEFAVNEVLRCCQGISRNYTRVYWIQCRSDHGDICAFRFSRDEDPIPFCLDQSIEFKNQGFWPMLVGSVRNENLPRRRFKAIPAGYMVTTYNKGTFPITLSKLAYTPCSYGALFNDLYFGAARGEPGLIGSNLLERYPRRRLLREHWESSLKELRNNKNLIPEIYEKALECNKTFEDYDLAVAKQESQLELTEADDAMREFQESLMPIVARAFKEIKKINSLYNFILTIENRDGSDFFTGESPLITNAAALATAHVSQRVDLVGCSNFSHWSSRQLNKLSFDYKIE